jgi:hypothetical protein
MAKKDESPAPSGAPVGVSVVSGDNALPDITMIVKEGATVGRDGKTYNGGDEVTVDAPTAMHFQQSGIADAKLDE